MTTASRLNVLLFKPNGVSDSITPVLGLGYLASSIKNKHDVTIIHGIKEHVGPVQFLQRLKQIRPDLVGFQVYTHDLAILPAYLDVLKKVSPGTWVVLGGPHPTATSNASLSLLDGLNGFVMKGEADHSFPNLVGAIADLNQGTGCLPLEACKKISGLVWREGDRICENESTWIKDLDTIPFPAWDLIQPKRFPPSPHAAFYKGFPVAPIVASRGCPYPCVYCAGRLTMGRTVRYRSVENVLEEVGLLLKQHKVKEIHLVDDNFTSSKDYVLRFCETIQKKRYKFFWTCPNGLRLNTLDEELLLAMKSSGCYAIAVGVESGSQRILDTMKKGLTLGEIRSKIDIIRRVGLTPIGFFLLGLPTETREEMDETVRFSVSLGLKRANFMLFHPFPGTEAFRWLRDRQDRNGLLLTAPSYAEVSYIPEGFSAGELKSRQRKAFLRFYLRPMILWGLVMDIRSLRHGYYVLRRVVRWMRSGR